MSKMNAYHVIFEETEIQNVFYSLFSMFLK